MFKSVFGGEEQRREETKKIIFEGSGWLLSIFEMLFSFQTQIKYLKLLPSMQFMMWKPNQPQILFSLSQLPTSFNLFKFDIYQCCPHLIALIIGFEKIFVYWSPLWLFWSQHCQSSLYLIWKQIKKKNSLLFYSLRMLFLSHLVMSYLPLFVHSIAYFTFPAKKKTANREQ